MANLADTGARTEYSSGALRETLEEKGRADLLPLEIVASLYKGTPYESIFKKLHSFQTSGDITNLQSILKDVSAENSGKTLLYSNLETMLLEVSVHYGDGAKKYDEFNWEKGLPCESFLDSAVRHLLKLIRGDIDEPHDRAFVWNVIGLLWTTVKKPELRVRLQDGFYLRGDETVPEK
jgi:hypothetical protein